MKHRKQKSKEKLYIIIAIAMLAFLYLIIKTLGILTFCIIVFMAVSGAILLLIKYQKKAKNKEQNSETNEDTIEIKDYSGKYEATELLSDHEMDFYKALKPIADNLQLSIISKVRMADLVKPTANYYRERSEYMSYFGKIKAKHVDFVLCDSDTLKVRLLIELDDKSHEVNRAIKRDEFVERVYQDTGYKLLRIYNNWDLEKKIRDAIGITEEEIL